MQNSKCAHTYIHTCSYRTYTCTHTYPACIFSQIFITTSFLSINKFITLQEIHVCITFQCQLPTQHNLHSKNYIYVHKYLSDFILIISFRANIQSVHRDSPIKRIITGPRVWYSIITINIPSPVPV